MLGWQFIDADFGLEARIGQKLIHILGKAGEKKYHECQFEILSSLLKQDNIVVTTDASVVSNKKNTQLLSSQFVVNLKVSIAAQLQRTSTKPIPLLLNETLSAFFDELHQDRDHLYEQVTTLSINADDHALEQHANIIVKTLKSEEVKSKRTLKTLTEQELIVFHKQLHSPVQLTQQQALCFKLLAQGISSKEIARAMNISYRTVEGNIAKLMNLLGCTSSKELITLYHNQP